MLLNQDDHKVYVIHKKTCCNSTEALAKCRQIGGSLANFKNISEQNLIKEELKEFITYSNLPPDVIFYIGLHRSSYSTWKWSDGTTYSPNNESWVEDELMGPMGIEDCVGIGSHQVGKSKTFGKYWDVDCSRKNKYICENGKVNYL